MPAKRTARLRQIALVATDLAATCSHIEHTLGLREPFRDPGVAEFGLVNAVYEVGDTFLEVVSPAREGTTAGRYLARQQGDAGYMALFQVPDTAATRDRATDLGLRVVWQIDLPDISGTHLHPKDVPGAIVSFDTPDPTASWRWGGPRWTGGAPDDATADAITGMVVGVGEPVEAATIWGSLLGSAPDGTEIALDGGRQHVCFAPIPAGGRWKEGIAEVTVAGLGGEATICGVRFSGP